jgi:LPS-assembly lipoprotein
MAVVPVVSRRRWVSGLLSGLTVAGLAGCGFRIRGQGVRMPFASVWLNAPQGGELIRSLVAQLQASGVTVTRQRPAEGAAQPETVLDVLQDQRERVVVGTTAAGQVRELQLRHRVRFRLRTLRGRDVLGETELLQERELSFNETQVLGKEEEEALLYADMRAGLVRQWMARLAAARLPI